MTANPVAAAMHDLPIVKHVHGWRLVAQYRGGKWYVKGIQEFWNRQTTDIENEDLEIALSEVSGQTDLMLAELRAAFGLQ